MRYLIPDFLCGFLAAQCFLAGILTFDIGGLGGLVARAEAPLLPVVMLALSLGGLIGAAAIATAALAPLPFPVNRRPAPAPARVRR